MQVDFETRDPEAARLRGLALDRLQTVLQRLGWQAGRVSIRLSDRNGPRGGVDKCCQVALRTERRESLMVRSVASDWRSAIEGALARAALALRRRLAREKRPVRPRPSAPGRTPALADPG
jgi:hypothetical protein